MISGCIEEHKQMGVKLHMLLLNLDNAMNV